MRIPSEALALYRPDGSRAFVDRDGAKPVAGSARVGSAVPKVLPPRPLTDATEGEGNDADARAGTADRRTSQGGSHGESHDESQRDSHARSGEESGPGQNDRRKEKFPVLIDTRLGRPRRQSEPAIDVTV